MWASGDCVINKLDGQAYIISDVHEGVAKLVSAGTVTALEVNLADLDEADLPPYETQRMNNILRNWRVAQGEGMWAIKEDLTGATTARARKTAPKKVEQAAVPLRRSSRKRTQTQMHDAGQTDDLDSEDDRADADASYEPEGEESPDECDDDPDLQTVRKIKKTPSTPPSKAARKTKARSVRVCAPVCNGRGADRGKNKPMTDWKSVTRVHAYRRVEIGMNGIIESQCTVEEHEAKALLSCDKVLCLACFYEDGLEVILFRVAVARLCVGSLLSFAVNNKECITSSWKVQSLPPSTNRFEDLGKFLSGDKGALNDHNLCDLVVGNTFVAVAK